MSGGKVENSDTLLGSDWALGVWGLKGLGLGLDNKASSLSSKFIFTQIQVLQNN